MSDQGLAPTAGKAFARSRPLFEVIRKTFHDDVTTSKTLLLASGGGESGARGGVCGRGREAGVEGTGMTVASPMQSPSGESRVSGVFGAALPDL